jgi:membrane protease YdiL (CAAX protease family)
MLRSPTAMIDEPLPPPVSEPEPVPPTPWGPLAASGLALVAFVLYEVLQGAVLVLFPGLLKAGNFGLAFTATTLASAPVGVLLVLGFAYLRKSFPVREYLGLHLPTLRQALASLALLAVFNLSYDQLTRLLHRPLVPDFMLSAYRTAHGLPGLYLAVVVAAPVFEELLFRGFLLPGLRSGLGAAGAAVLSSLAFALPHLQYDRIDMAAVFVLGLLFAGVRLRTGSTLLTIALHAITNLVATLQVAWVLSHPAVYHL